MNRTAKIIIVIETLLLVFFFVFSRIVQSEREKEMNRSEMLALEGEMQKIKAEKLAADAVEAKNETKKLALLLKECEEGK